MKSLDWSITGNVRDFNWQTAIIKCIHTVTSVFVEKAKALLTRAYIILYTF